MKWISEEDLKEHIIRDNCDEGCGYIDERDIIDMEWVEDDKFIPLSVIDSMLDKIRAEIEKAVWEDVIVSLDGTDEVRIPRLEPDDVFKIIDKYRKEQYGMTREEKRTRLIRHLKYNRSIGADYLITDEDADEIIKALEQELCEDISEDGTLTVNVEDGTKVRRVFVCGDNHFGGLYYPEQEPKTGHWISNAEDDLKISEYTCSNCKGLSDKDSDFCPKCGAKMGEVQDE